MYIDRRLELEKLQELQMLLNAVINGGFAVDDWRGEARQGFNYLHEIIDTPASAVHFIDRTDWEDRGLELAEGYDEAWMCQQIAELAEKELRFGDGLFNAYFDAEMQGWLVESEEEGG